MLSTLLVASALAVQAADQPSPRISQLQSIYITHDGDDSLGTQFVAELKTLLEERGLRLESSDAAESHALVVVSIRAVNERTSQQMGSVIALTLLRPDDTFVKMWVYTLNHRPGHAKKQAADFIADFDRMRAGPK
jgi:hypothetical protein